jgi:ABC-type dipeptide/oligopeptide/nickel transport system permease component
MAAYLGRRFVGSIPVILLITLLVFSLLHAAPGDPAALLLPESATDADIAAARVRWGLDQPLYIQYGHFLANTLQGDLGTSFRFSEPVRQLIAERLPATVELTVLAMLIALAIAIPIGTVAGASPNSWRDNAGTTLGLFGISVPSFWSGIMLILVFAGILHVVPSAGRSTYGVAGPSITGFYVLDSLLTGNLAGVGDALSHLAMPALALGAGLAGITMRITRSSVLEAGREDFVVVARAKGLIQRTVLRRHVLRNALLPVVTIVGLEFGEILANTVIVETVFAWPGMGSLLVTGVGSRDYPLVTGLVLLYAIIFVLINLAVDGLYAVIDPRIRY